MDPNQTLKEIRECARRIADNDHTEDQCEELATLVQALDEWLTGGGFLPQAWNGDRDTEPG